MAEESIVEKWRNDVQEVMDGKRHYKDEHLIKDPVRLLATAIGSVAVRLVKKKRQRQEKEEEEEGDEEQHEDEEEDEEEEVMVVKKEKTEDSKPTKPKKPSRTPDEIRKLLEEKGDGILTVDDLKVLIRDHNAKNGTKLNLSGKKEVLLEICKKNGVL